jgi:hypothetical protein
MTMNRDLVSLLERQGYKDLGIQKEESKHPGTNLFERDLRGLNAKIRLHRFGSKLLGLPKATWQAEMVTQTYISGLVVDASFELYSTTYLNDEGVFAQLRAIESRCIEVLAILRG